MNRREYRTVLVAALLYDVGKPFLRGDPTSLIEGQHPEFSVSFVQAFADQSGHCSDVTLLKTLVQHHHV